MAIWVCMVMFCAGPYLDREAALSVRPAPYRSAAGTRLVTRLLWRTERRRAYGQAHERTQTLFGDPGTFSIGARRVADPIRRRQRTKANGLITPDRGSYAR